MAGLGSHFQKTQAQKIDVRSKMEGTSIFLIATRAAVTAHPGAGLAAYFDAAGAEAGAAALASSAFLSVLSFLAFLTCFTFFSVAGLASAFTSGAGAGVLATAEADADATATGAEADAALAGAVGVVANALPIKTVEAIRAVMSLFMVIVLKLCERFFCSFVFYWQPVLPV